MMESLAKGLRRVSLGVRLMANSVFAVVLAGALLLYITAKDDAASARQDLQTQLNVGLQTLLPLITEQAIIGDYSTIQQILDIRAERGDVVEVAWLQGDDRVGAGGNVGGLVAPEWFVNWQAIPDLQGRAEIKVGGRSYGDVFLHLTAKPLLAKNWRSFLRKLGLLFLALVLDLVGVWVIIYFGVRPIRALAEGATRFGSGEHSVRLSEAGPPEIAVSIHAFNDMAEKIEALLLSQRKFHKAIEQSATLVLITDQEGRLEYVNHRVCEATGYSEEELAGQNPRMFKSGESPGEIFRQLWHTISSGRSWQGEFRNRRKNGELFWVSATVSPIRNEHGDITNYVAVEEDISARKEAEEALRSLSRSLEERVHEEVGKNREKDHLLIQQSRLAAMGEMIGNIAHQWRQPINALNILLANIHDAYEFGELDASYLDETIARGNRIVQSMSATIDDFRNFFRPNKEASRFSAQGAVQSALNLFSAALQARDIRVEIRDEGHPAYAFGFPNEFSQVMLNLLSNARDAIAVHRQAGGEIVLAIGGTEDGKIQVAMRNNGGNIPEDVLPKVFDPYFTTKEKGTGIGLYMSKMIMEHMGGSIVVENVDDGVEFRLTVPAASH